MSKLTVVMAQGGDWEALYEDGKLAEQGHSVTDEAYKRAGIELRYDEQGALLDGKQGRETYEACAKTLDELEAREQAAIEKAQNALTLRQQAQQLLDQAGTLDGRPLVVAHKDELVKGARADRWVKP